MAPGQAGMARGPVPMPSGWMDTVLGPVGTVPGPEITAPGLAGTAPGPVDMALGLAGTAPGLVDTAPGPAANPGLALYMRLKILSPITWPVLPPVSILLPRQSTSKSINKCWKCSPTRLHSPFQKGSAHQILFDLAPLCWVWKPNLHGIILESKFCKASFSSYPYGYTFRSVRWV